MTLEEAIKHAKTVARENKMECSLHSDQLGYIEKFYDREKCAEEHLQLAEWLKELKHFREAKEFITKMTKDVKKEFSLNPTPHLTATYYTLSTIEDILNVGIEPIY